MADETDPATASQSRFEALQVRRIATWTGAGLFALTALVASAVSKTGQERIREAITRAVPAETVTAQIPQPPQPDPEIAELKETLRSLAAERQNLAERVASLERTLDDVTGSIKRINEKPVEPPKLAEMPKPNIVAAAPAIAAPATVVAGAPESFGPAAPSAASADVPLPPVRVASAPQPETAEAPPAKTDIGVDIGGASTPEALRIRWSAVKANFGPLLGPLKAVMVMQERAPGVVSYRLVLAPIASHAAASALCARLIAAQASCRPTTFNAQSAALL
ncbi:MAG: hypothetical protein JOZ70_07970 [Pseudolabrys sp.]|nr:hypothetical protein [Pseudolabrys sp.]